MKREERIDWTALGVRSVQTLLGVADHVAASGVWQSATPIRQDVFVTVRSMFETLAWSDQRLDGPESRMYDALISLDVRFRDHYSVNFEGSPRDAFGAELPNFIRAAIEHDRKYNLGLSQVALNAIENLGRAIIAVNNVVLDREAKALATAMQRLRALNYALEPRHAVLAGR